MSTIARPRGIDTGTLASKISGSSAKARKNCDELVMTECGVVKIRGMEQYTNLEVLRLTKNRITAIVNLEANFRLRRLYLAQNRVSTLVGSCLPFLRQLEVLDISGNDISGLKETCEVLGNLQKLQRLYIRDNPAANEECARLYLIHMLPWIEQCDGKVVTDEERLQAKEASQKLGWMKGGATPKPKTIQTAFGKGYVRPPLPAKVPDTSCCERMLNTKANKILLYRGRDERQRKERLSTYMGAVSQEAPAEALAPYGHDTDAPCKEAIEFRTQLQQTQAALKNSKRRPQSARPARSGDQPPRAFWATACQEDKPNPARPKSAHPAGVRKDPSIVIDSDMYTRFTKTRRQQAANGKNKKLVSFDKPTVKISTTQGLDTPPRA